jgi:hypothetical protein
MSTYAETIRDALKLIGVLNETESVSAEQGADGLIVLNDLMALWESVGIYLGHVPSDTPSDTMVYPQKYRLAIKSNLAVALCPHYDRTPTPILLAMAASSYNRMSCDAIYNQAKPTSLDTMSSQRRISFIESGP